MIGVDDSRESKVIRNSHRVMIETMRSVSNMPSRVDTRAFRNGVNDGPHLL
jgi:hypothetical protein